MKDSPSLATPHLSVVIPVHNAERYVAAAVRSALDPSLPDVEILVIDDGSTDRSAEEARAINDPRVTVIRERASGGPARPRNVGLGRARAPYVALLDADDVLKPGRLAASVAALDRCPSAGFTFGDYERVDADGKVLEPSVLSAYPGFRALPTLAVEDGWRLIPQTTLARGLLYENFIATGGAVIRADLARFEGGFDETLTNSDDRDMWFRLAHRCDALYSPQLGFSYRKHSTSITHRPPIRYSVSRITVLRRERERWSDKGARRQLNRLIAENYASIGYQRRQQRQRWAAAGSFLQAFVTSPNVRWVRGFLGSVVS